MKATLPALFCTLVHLGCGPDRFAPPGPPEPPSTVVNLDEVPGEACTDTLMVRITPASGDSYCIDRFEAVVEGALLGNPNQGSDDADVSLDGSTRAVARVELQTQPRAALSWYQAKASCENAGKRLCSVQEWERACRGPDLLVYPYGDTIDDTACNGFFQNTGGDALPTGSLNRCGSAEGVYDMSGNLAEWTATPVPRFPGAAELNDRTIRGGSFRSNLSALRCVGDEFHLPPGTMSEEIGFRCCVDDAP